MLSLLIRVLAFSDEEADHVQVTISSSRPYDSETGLCLWIFADVESNLVLTVFHISKFGIGVSSPG